MTELFILGPLHVLARMALMPCLEKANRRAPSSADSSLRLASPHATRAGIRSLREESLKLGVRESMLKAIKHQSGNPSRILFTEENSYGSPGPRPAR